MAKIMSFFITVILMLQSLPLAWVPTLTVDASKQLQEVSTRATGHLYGLAEEGVPSEAMTNSLDISSVSQKVIDGLQHPTGDVDHVVSQLDSCDYIVVYLQDSFSTWYYCYDEIMEMRRNGTYDWKAFITERYFPLVREKVESLMNKDYSDRIVYCIYNECDNGVWFGNYKDGQVLYDHIGKSNFYEAWKMTYDLVKEICPDAVIGGPGFCDYETNKQRDFMNYVAENNCVPEIMIYHELAWWSTYDWQMHVDDYRKIEKDVGITTPLPIVVTEYGTMEDCGNPARMLHYVYQIENSGTWGQMAYWRLANNLNDTAADDNSPNSNWWLYRKYAEMEGKLLETKVSALKNKDLYDDDIWYYSYKGLAAFDEEDKEINIIALGSENKRAVKIKNLDKTNLGKRVNVKVECVYYQGLTGIVSSPITLLQYNTGTSMGNLNINIPGTDTNAVYFITLSQENEEAEVIRNTNIPVRYEFEEGTLLGDAYTYDSAYATTGELSGMVGGMEKKGDGVKITVNIPKAGLYDFGIIYGNANNGTKKEDRDYTSVNFTIDKNTRTLSFPSTIKSEYTDLYTLTLELSAGRHTVEFSNNNGHFVLDSMLVSRHEDKAEISLLPDGDNRYLAVAPEDGYYKLNCSNNTSGTVDGAKADFSQDSLIYLRRGLNEIALENEASISFSKEGCTGSSFKINAAELELSGSASLKEDHYGNSYVDGISSEGGCALLKTTVPHDGEYRITVEYANNLEGGYHAYNVDLIESMITVSTKNETRDIFLRNTYSNFTYKTMTFNLLLEEGENEILISNSGSTLFNNSTSYAPRIKSLTVNGVNG